MAARVVRLLAIVFVMVFAGTGVFVIYLCASPVPLHEFDSSWYHAHQEVTEASATTFRAQHWWTVFRAQGDHFVHRIGPGRIIGLVAASSPMIRATFFCTLDA